MDSRTSESGIHITTESFLEHARGGGGGEEGREYF